MAAQIEVVECICELGVDGHSNTNLNSEPGQLSPLPSSQLFVCVCGHHELLFFEKRSSFLSVYVWHYELLF